MSQSPDFDVIIVGAGLSGSLLAWTLAHKRPDLRIALIESQHPLPHKTWSFHESDLGDSLSFFRPLISTGWSSYEVKFQSYQRRLNLPYASVRPRDLDFHIRAVLREGYVRGRSIVEVQPQGVRESDGTFRSCRCVIDARGKFLNYPAGAGYQKFVGLHCDLQKPHGLSRPILMDATVPQIDGYRFFYILPISRHELLIEDTRYSNSPELVDETLMQEIALYMARQGWSLFDVTEVERGVLPLPLGPAKRNQQNVPLFGVGADFFHPVTGYSFPEAAYASLLIADLPHLTSEAVRHALNLESERQTSQKSFFHLLNRMMFRAAEPEQRFQIFERFYRMPEALIRNFYRGRLKMTDKIRLLAGRPPVPFTKALQSSFEGFPS